MLYHTLENNLSRLLSLKKKHSEKLSLFAEKAIEMGNNCNIQEITGDKLMMSIILSQASMAELEGAKLNKVEGTPPNLQEASPR